MDKELTDNSNLIAVFEDFPIGSILLNEKGQIILANNQFLDIFSLSKKQLLGTSVCSILSLPTKQKNTDFHALFNPKSGSKVPLVTIEDKEGKKHVIEFKTYNSIKGDGRIYAGSLIKNMENLNQKDVKTDELEEESELSEMKSRFLYIASHEFRTPLAGILSSLNLIERYLKADQEAWFRFKNREKVTNHFAKIKGSVKNLTAVLTKFLALGNIEKGEIPVKRVSFDLVRALETQKRNIQEICKPGQKIIYCHKGKETSVCLDRHLLKNIMNNLFSNAIKFSHENSRIELRTEISSEKISIELQDEGIGIPEAEQNKVFRRFFRARNALTLQEGTGLGLNIVKKYVMLMKGTIACKSEENKGTTFYITFPNNSK